MVGKTKETTMKTLARQIEVLNEKLIYTTTKFKAQIRQLEINLQEQMKTAENDILETTDMTKKNINERKCFNVKTDKKLPKHRSKLLKCQVCDMEFEKFCDLEWHVKAQHEECQTFECNTCMKTFVTEWRLKKHVKIHTNKITKQCNYFIGNMSCPFDELCCKFLHSLSIDSVLKSADNLDENTCGTMENVMKDDVDVEIEDLTNLTDTNEESKETTSFITSTPKRQTKRCEDCLDEWECVNCLISSTLKRHGDTKKFF